MAERVANPGSEYARERALYRYSMALERGDLAAVAAILAEAEQDPALEAQILDLNLACAEEDAAASYAQDAAQVRSIVQKHLPGAFANTEVADLPPLTVGEVAAHVKVDAARDARTAQEVQTISRRLIADATLLPEDLSKPSIRRLFAHLGVQVSDGFGRLFRDTAIHLSMGREQNNMRMAATRRQQRQSAPPGDRKRGNDDA